MSESLSTQPSWYAVYTRARHEKRVEAGLSRRGLEAYLPLVARVSQWHDRKKTVHWPMFPGYVFARFRPGDASTVVATPGAVHVVSVSGRPLPIPDDDIENVRRFADCLAATGEVPRQAPTWERGQSLAVRSGPFAGVRGVVLEQRGTDRVLIQIGLETIGQALKVELDAADVAGAPA